MQRVSRISLARKKSCLSRCTNVRLNVCKTNFLSVKIIVSKQGRVSNFQDLIFNVQLDEFFIMYYSPFFLPNKEDSRFWQIFFFVIVLARIFALEVSTD